MTERLSLKLNDLPDLKEHITAVQLVTFFLERSGLLLNVGANEIQFAHRSFQEFFTAKYMVKESEWDILRNNATNSYWHQTIQMAVGVCQSSKENERFLNSLLNRTNKLKVWRDGQQDAMIYLLVLHCKEAMREISPKFDEQLKGIIPKIIPPPTQAMVDALVAAGELAVPYLKFRDDAVNSMGMVFLYVKVLINIASVA